MFSLSVDGVAKGKGGSHKASANARPGNKWQKFVYSQKECIFRRLSCIYVWVFCGLVVVFARGFKIFVEISPRRKVFACHALMSSVARCI